MKKLMLLSLMLGALPLTMMAQDDDMYFVPTKKAVEKQKSTYALPQNVYYPGCNRSVDEYNRRVAQFPVASDTTACDTIDFDGLKGVYPDSVLEDYQLTREMSRWDGYEPKDSYWDGYADGRHDAMVNWHSPWFYSDYYLWWDPWLMDRYYLYHGIWGSHWYWYDPIYMSYYFGWYGYGSWYYPGYYAPYYPGYAYYGTGTTGTQNHGTINYGGPRGVSNGRSTAYSAGTFGGSRIGTVNRSTGSLGTRNTTSTAGRTTSTASRTTNAYGNFGGSRARTATSSSSSSSRSYTPTTTTSSGSYSSGSSSSSSGGGSFGGSSTVGGSRSTGGGGGGGFGGRR